MRFLGLFLAFVLATPVYAGKPIIEAGTLIGQATFKDYLKVGNFERNVLGWSAYADAAGTVPVDCTGGSPTLSISRTTTNPLSGVGSGLLTKDAANRQGEGVSAAFILDRDVSLNPQDIIIRGKYEVASGSFTEGSSSDIRIYVYDVTNTALETVNAVYLDGGFFEASFSPTPAATSFRVCLHQATTSASAYTLKVDGITVSELKKNHSGSATSGHVLTADGAGRASYSAITGTGNEASLLENCSITASVAANALTIALKDAAGNDPSPSSPCRVAMRSSTLGSGVYNVRTVTGALSTVISSGSTAGHTSGAAHNLYTYLIDNAGTLELAWSSRIYDEAIRVSTTAEGGAGAADSGTVMYSTTARTDVPLRMVSRIISTQATAGTWATAPSMIASGPRSLVADERKAPTITRFTSGSGTYVPPTGAKYLVVTLHGAGGGGAGSGTGSSGGTGGTGGNTTFGSNTAAGGVGGTHTDTGGVGGAGGTPTVSGATTIISLTGGRGANPATSFWSTGGTPTANFAGGQGCISPFGGQSGTDSRDAVANTGAGGTGGPGSQTANHEAGGGGACGAYIKVLYPGPLAASYSYGVGAAGTAGSAGTSGAAGGAGGSGVIIIEEYYQ